MAIGRFKSRREHVQVTRSDNGTNFVGAALKLKDAFKTIDRSKVNRFSPWWEGAWKSLIKSNWSILIKPTLKVFTLDRVFTDEDLYTFICETECIMNERRHLKRE